MKKLLIKSSVAKEIREILMSKAGFDENKIRRDEGGRFAITGGAVNAGAEKETAIKKLEELAIPMPEVEFSKENFDALFPNGKINTPIGEVKIGANQYQKLRDRDSGGRSVLLGAMHHTLSDPITVIFEGGTQVYIKSFKANSGTRYNTIMSVVVDIGGHKVSVSTYQRKQREVINKIKGADGIAYVKSNPYHAPVQTASEDTRQLGVLSQPLKKSSHVKRKRLFIKIGSL